MSCIKSAVKTESAQNIGLNWFSFPRGAFISFGTFLTFLAFSSPIKLIKNETEVNFVILTYVALSFQITLAGPKLVPALIDLTMRSSWQFLQEINFVHIIWTIYYFLVLLSRTYRILKNYMKSKPKDLTLMPVSPLMAGASCSVVYFLNDLFDGGRSEIANKVWF